MADESDLPLWEITQTAHVARRLQTDVFAEFGLSPPQYGVLLALLEGADVAKADLARRVLVRPQSMGRMIDDMVRAGLVSRAGPGGRGRRAVVEITEAGRAAVLAAGPAIDALNTPAALGLSRSEIQELSRLLRRVRDHVAATDPTDDGAVDR